MRCVGLALVSRACRSQVLGVFGGLHGQGVQFVMSLAAAACRTRAE